MRKPLLAANWKMYKTVRDAVVYTQEFRRMVKDISDADIVLAPPFTALHAVADAARNAPLGVAGQPRGVAQQRPRVAVQHRPQPRLPGGLPVLGHLRFPGSRVCVH